MNSSVEDKSVERLIKDTLIDLGIRPNLKGFWYTLECVKITMQSGLRCDIKTMTLYEAAGEKYGVTGIAAERSIRLCVKRIYERGNWDAITGILGSSNHVQNGRITAGEFVWTLADYIDYITTQEDDADD